MTENEFWEKYKPIKNNIDNNASFDGYMFETFGKELEAVRSAWLLNPLKVWTITDSEDFDHGVVVSAGYHWVNRLGYFITEVPAENEDLQWSDTWNSDQVEP